MQAYYTCPKKFEIDEGGARCKRGIKDAAGDGNCDGYCEVRLTMTYGQEVPFNQDCRKDESCDLAQNMGVSKTTGFSITAGITGGLESDESIVKAAFNFGATWEWSTTITTQVTQTVKHTGDNATCGHFSFGESLRHRPSDERPLANHALLSSTLDRHVLRHAKPSQAGRERR